MKFMISCRQPLVFLKDAEEIKVNYSDIARLQDFVTPDWTCTADIVVYIPNNQLIQWEKIDCYREKLNIIIAVEKSTQIPFIKNKKNYPVFWMYPASNYAELRSLISLGVNQILLDGPLYFDLPKVKALCGPNIELRIVVNKCFNNNLPLTNGICGTYVRPEDISIYSQFIDHFEFDADDSIKKEHTLYTIYKQDKNWPGNLNILLTNLNVDVDNRGFEVFPFEDYEDEKFFAHRRISCKQKCQELAGCDFCPKIFNFIKTFQDHIEKTQIQLEKENIK